MRYATLPLIAILAIAMPILAQTATQPAATPTAAPATQPSTAAAPTTKPSAAMAKPALNDADGWIAYIGKSDNPFDVRNGYLQASSVNKNDVELHRAYIRRMLQLGLPQFTTGAAQRVLIFKPHDSLAWGVLAYNSARGNHFPAAFNAVIHALEYDRANPGNLHNAGELVAWLEHNPSVTGVGQWERGVLEEIRSSLNRHEDFTRAYDRTIDMYVKREPQLDDMDRQIAQLTRDVDGMKRQANDIDSRLREIDASIRYSNDSINSWQYTANNVWGPAFYGNPYYFGYRAGGYPPDTYMGTIYSHQLYLDQLNQFVVQEQTNIRKLNQQGQDLYNQGHQLLHQIQDKSNLLAQLKAQRDKSATMRDVFDWQPPAVDDVITPARDKVPPGLATTRPINDEYEAMQHIDMAQLYMDNDMNERAAQLLNEVIRNYGHTQAAERARNILEHMD